MPGIKIQERNPRRRKPSPPGKVDRAQPGTDEGDPARPKNRAKMNGNARRGGYQPPANLPKQSLWSEPLRGPTFRAAPNRSSYRPTPVRASPCHPLPGEGFSPHPSGPMALPPSPEGKATSGGGCWILALLNSYSQVNNAPRFPPCGWPPARAWPPGSGNRRRWFRAPGFSGSPSPQPSGRRGRWRR